MHRFSLSLQLFFRNHKAGILARWRSWYWRTTLANRPTAFSVMGKILIRHPQRVFLGTDVGMSEGVYINARDEVHIGDHVRFSAFVRINTGALPLDVPPNQRNKHTSAPVHIGNDVWLATGVIVNPGVTIHDGVIVGAGAVVTSDLPPYTLCVGIPAKPIRQLPRPTESPSP